MSAISVRFAPSPSGFLHMGNIRTALFNYLFARHEGGRFLLRIEDTDRETSTSENEQVILDTMKWLGLDWDDEIARQSEHKTRHLEEAERLLNEGHAYRCRCTPEELGGKRKAAEAGGQKWKYDGTCRDKNHPDDGTPFCVRLRVPQEGETQFHDIIKGEMSIQNAEVGDIIIVRTDGGPIYNFAVTVDDHDMEITHVIRGDGHLTNTVPQILLNKALGYAVPNFAHLPLVWAPDKKPLAKRRGAKAVLEYRDDGYLSDAMVNYMARLGWGHGDQEYFTREELIEKFTLDAVQSAPATYDPKKMEWLNGEHIRAHSTEEVIGLLDEYLEITGARPLSAVDFPHLPDWKTNLIDSVKERARTLDEMIQKCRFCLVDEVEYEEKAVRKELKAHAGGVFADVVEAIDAWPEGEPGIEDWQNILAQIMEKRELNMRKVAQPIRVALSGGTVSPPIDSVLATLGKERVRERVTQAAGLVQA